MPAIAPRVPSRSYCIRRTDSKKQPAYGPGDPRQAAGLVGYGMWTDPPGTLALAPPGPAPAPVPPGTLALAPPLPAPAPVPPGTVALAPPGPAPAPVPPGAVALAPPSPAPAPDSPGATVVVGVPVSVVTADVVLVVLVVELVLEESPLSPPPQPTATTVRRAPPNRTRAVRGVEFIGDLFH